MADIYGTPGADFTFTISAGTIVRAILDVPGRPYQALTVHGSGREVTVPNLPAGDSVVRLDLVWAPGDADAVIDVGTSSFGTVTVATPKPTLDAGVAFAFVGTHGTDDPPW